MVRFEKRDRECALVYVFVCVREGGREREYKIAMVFEISCLIRTKMAGCFCLHSYILFCVVIDVFPESVMSLVHSLTCSTAWLKYTVIDGCCRGCFAFLFSFW